MTKSRICLGCGKMLANRHNLSRHKKICKGGKNHFTSELLNKSNISFPAGRCETAGNFKDKSTDKDVKLGSTEEESDGNSKLLSVSTGSEGSTDGDASSDSIGSEVRAVDGMDASSVSGSSDEDGVSSSSNNGSEDLNSINLWESLVEFTIKMKKWNIFDTLCYFLSPYYLLSEDEVYQGILSDIEEVQYYQDYNYLDALDYAVDKNKDLILSSVDNAVEEGGGDDNSFNIWSVLAAVSLKDINKGCHWLSYSSCYCDECHGSCMIPYLKYLLQIFRQMEMDKVIETVMVTLKQIMAEDDVSVWDATHIAVEKHEKIILDKVREADKNISDKIMGVSSGAGMYYPWSRE